MSTNEVEVKARAMGWRPKEQFRGAEKNWVDAETYVQRADQVMPILKENNQRLEGELNETKTRLAAAEALVAESQEAIKDLAKFNSEVMRDRALAKKAELLEGIKAAKTDGNVDAEVELTDQLTTHNAALLAAEAAKKVETKPPVTTPPNDATIQAAKAEFTQWAKDNAWYGTDDIKTGIANGVAAKLRKESSPLVGKAFYEEVASQVEAILGGNPLRTAADKTEGGGRGTGGGGGGSSNGATSKTWADLDQTAKDACDRFNKTLVGPGKSYKTVEDWRKQYAADYFSRT